ncbi:uncharacterized protein PITG_11830 [Phytophthora infestans T30-4]|uniref:Uncharacterized protein n=1 Tax=Phytophthora infestans (strain T30-4) TaxID=403677 RepID=D0NHX3_PHYIT|nr:uncharacterized protein PITG_11830 [Phytophthora infestans T30-4]EEY58848.1 hypothetical protein PITG_11830 [Phytophthora infestans T30-4]|eukprot:XP_002901321.1 hypothetical protein PITG_11830 [Phytophthora infestans T30-4]
MDSYTLYPPNSQSFSDDVIGSVVQRGWLFNECTQGEDGDYFTYHKDSHPSSYSLNRKAYNIHDRRIISIATIQAPIVEKNVINSTVKGEERQRDLRRMRQSFASELASRLESPRQTL